MRTMRNKYVVVFTKFIQAKELHMKALFCFYEGEDAKYYGRRVEYITKRSCDNIISYNCGGRTGVLKVFELINSKNIYSHVNLAFFIDGDFIRMDRLDNKIYQTTGYSIENYYTSLSAFSRILNYVFCISCNSDDYNRCIKDYENSLNDFHKQVIVLNAWIKAHRIHELKSGTRELELSKLKISKYFNAIQIDKITIKQEINKELLEKEFPGLPIIDKIELDKNIKELSYSNMQQSLRGKFEFEFLRRIVDDLKTKNKNGDYFSEKYECIKIDPNVDPLLLFGQCADTPENLVTFLKQFSIN